MPVNVCLAGAIETAPEGAGGGTQPTETLPNASNMVRDSAVAESGAPGAREAEEDDDADGAADGTQSNDIYCGCIAMGRDAPSLSLVLPGQNVHRARHWCI